MTRLLGAAVMSVLLITACTDEDEPTAPTVSSNGDVPGAFYRTEVDGLDCVVWIHNRPAGIGDEGSTTSHSRDSYSGISCDWGPQ